MHREEGQSIACSALASAEKKKNGEKEGTSWAQMKGKRGNLTQGSNAKKKGNV